MLPPDSPKLLCQFFIIITQSSETEVDQPKKTDGLVLSRKTDRFVKQKRRKRFCSTRAIQCGILSELSSED